MFTRAMQLGLAEAFVQCTTDRPEGDEERLAASTNMGTALLGQGKYAGAEAILFPPLFLPFSLLLHGS